MSRQIQIRRGTAAEHTTFTGAIGEITMDTTNNTLRVHDGTTAGGTPLAKQSEIPEQYVMPENYDFVVECQAPTSSNNYTWYRKYKSGWVEMGGVVKGGYSQSTSWKSRTITLPVEMQNTDYVHTVMMSWNFSSGASGVQDEIYCASGTTTEMTWSYINVSNSNSMFCNWVARGLYAQE